MFEAKLGTFLNHLSLNPLIKQNRTESKIKCKLECFVFLAKF